jgi:hypothetical protein
MRIYPHFNRGTIGTIAYALGKTPTFVCHLKGCNMLSTKGDGMTEVIRHRPSDDEKTIRR